MESDGNHADLQLGSALGATRLRGWRPLVMRAGLAGFLFFLIKGLLWLALPYLLFLIGARS